MSKIPMVSVYPIFRKGYKPVDWRSTPKVEYMFRNPK